MEEHFQIAMLIGEAVLSVVVGWAGKIFHKWRQSEEARLKHVQLLERGAIATLRITIVREINHYTEKGFAPHYAAKTIEELYEIYHELGGNGGIDALMQDFRNLPHAAVKVEKVE